MGRVKSVERNIAFGYAGTLITAVLGFVLKQVFIANLDETLLGVNGLYTGVLSMLNMAELGIGTALNYSLYGPVARGETEKIKSYMLMYKRAYRTIAMVVAVIGLLVTPFLKYIIREPGDNTLRDLTLYYLIFLFNTVSTYFVSYKYSLVNAEQKNYIQTNVITMTKFVTVLLQMLVLVTTKNFYWFLLTDAAVQLIQKVFVNAYLNRLYPYLLDRNVTPLSKEETGDIWTKTRALVWHRVGDAARLQTDSIIISSFIAVAVAGVVDNYNQVIITIGNFVTIIFNSVISSFGNLIATESKEKQFDMFSIYRFLASWIYGFATVAFLLMLTPFVRLWLGDAWVLPAISVQLILLDFYFKGERLVLSNFKTAAGVFEQDKYLAMIQGAVNLVLSIVLVQKIGLPGIYIGTVVSGLIANITKPIIIYRVCFDKGAGHYFLDSLRYILVTLVLLAGLYAVVTPLLAEVTIPKFLLGGILVTLVYNGAFVLLFHRTKEFAYLLEIVKRKIGKA